MLFLFSSDLTSVLHSKPRSVSLAYDNLNPIKCVKHPFLHVVKGVNKQTIPEFFFKLLHYYFLHCGVPESNEISTNLWVYLIYVSKKHLSWSKNWNCSRKAFLDSHILCDLRTLYLVWTWLHTKLMCFMWFYV